MDPTATLKLVKAGDKEAAFDLLDWLRGNGFPPDGETHESACAECYRTISKK